MKPTFDNFLIWEKFLSEIDENPYYTHENLWRFAWATDYNDIIQKQDEIFLF